MIRHSRKVKFLVQIAFGVVSAAAAAGAADDATAAFQKFFPAFVAYNQDRVAERTDPAGRILEKRINPIARQRERKKTLGSKTPAEMFDECVTSSA